MTVPRDMTPDKLRYIAESLDHLSKLGRMLMEPVANGLSIEAAKVNVELELTGVTPDGARTILGWIDRTEQQDDLRRWADEMEGQS